MLIVSIGQGKLKRILSLSSGIPPVLFKQVERRGNLPSSLDKENRKNST